MTTCRAVPKIVCSVCIVLVLSLGAALLVASCSGEGDGSNTPADDNFETGAPSTSKAVSVRSVLDVTFRTLEGEEKKISDFDRKLLLVNYIETWNNDSKRLVPIMNEIQREREPNVTVLGVLNDRGASAARTFIGRNDVQFEILLPGGDPGRFGKPEWLPTTHVVTKEGELVHSFKKLHTKKEYDDFINGMNRRRK
jgi:hypothetical protein